MASGSQAAASSSQKWSGRTETGGMAHNDVEAADTFRVCGRRDIGRNHMSCLVRLGDLEIFRRHADHRV